MSKVTNVVIAGLGGQGVLKASDILSEAAFRTGLDVKKAEVHGMSQRGGSVNTDVRYGEEVNSPMVPDGEAEFMVILDSTQVEPNVGRLAKDGVLLLPSMITGEECDVDDLNSDDSTPVDRKNFNVAMLGLLSTYLDIPEEHWIDAVLANLPAKLHDLNKEVFAAGKAARK